MRPVHPISFGAMTIASYGRTQIVGGQGEGLDREGAGAGGLIPGCLQLVHRFPKTAIVQRLDASPASCDRFSWRFFEKKQLSQVFAGNGIPR
jgi:hypothetical protein